MWDAVLSTVRVYPRVCGGNPFQRRLDATEKRSIPACAGEPRMDNTPDREMGVYPRVCGGTTPERVWRLCPGGSIPACAGEPGLPLSFLCLGKGLSPRVRGNRNTDKDKETTMRSIPACAGEPGPRLRMSAAGQVYPRVCGGTDCSISKSLAGLGLSPRVRGNRDSLSDSDVSIGSIPACAGEPSTSCFRACWFPVYPRVCGGNQPRMGGLPGAERSIPACAGEPVLPLVQGPVVGVYPRVCGGTLLILIRITRR